jgi:hypothetical protein
MTTDVRAERHARRQELERLSKLTLAKMHADNGGIMGVGTYKKWTKEELINTVLDDELVRS